MMMLIVCQRNIIIISYMKGLRFSFPQSIIATHPASPSYPDPVLLRLPPEQPLISFRKPIKPQYPEYSSTSKQDNYVLMYSPDVPISPSNPRSQLPNTSPFKKRPDDTTPRRYLVKPYDAEIEVKLINESRDGNNSASIRSQGHRIRTNRETNDKPYQTSIQEQSKPIKKPDKSLIKKLNFDLETQNNQKTTRPKQSSLQKQNSFKVDRFEPQQKISLQRQIQELRNKLNQSQIMNASLLMQYQQGRQKLASREAEIQTLNESYDQLQRLYEESDKSLQNFIKTEAQFLQNKSMMTMSSQQIQKQKEIINALNKRLEQIQPQIMAMEQMNASWQIRLKKNDKKWQAELQQNDKNWEQRLKNERDACQLQFQTQEREQNNLKGTIHSLKSQIEGLSLQISSKDSTIHELQDQIHQLKGQMHEYKEKLQKKQQSIDQFQQKTIQDLNKQGQSDEIIKNLENQLKSQIQQNELLINKLKKLQQQLILKQQQIKTLFLQQQQKKRKHQKEIDTLHRQKQYQTQKNKEQVLKLTSQICGLQIVKKQLQQNLEKCYRQRDEAITKVQKLQDISSKLLVDIAESSKQIGIVKVANGSKQIEMDKLKNKSKQLQAQIFKLNQEKTQAQSQINALNDQLNNKQKQIQRLLTQKSTITDQSNSKSGKIDQLQQKILNYHKVIASYKQSLNHLKSTFQQRWQQLKSFYQQQFQGLQTQLKEFSDAENSKRNFRSFKKHQLAKQNKSPTITTTTATVETKVLSQSDKPNSAE